MLRTTDYAYTRAVYWARKAAHTFIPVFLSRGSGSGFTLVEVVIALMISAVIFSGAMIAYRYAIKAFDDAAGTSEAIETKTSLTELVYRYFERWGVGVPSRDIEEDGLSACTGTAFSDGTGPDICPPRRKFLSISGGSSGCSHSVSFYGNIYGTGIVQNIADNDAHLVSCRLDNSTPARENCFYLWRGLRILNPVDTKKGDLIPFGFSTSRGSTLRPPNASCSEGFDTHNASAGRFLGCRRQMETGDTCAEASPILAMQTGDVIHRAPHFIQMYCAPFGRDPDRETWLYVNLTDTARDCTAIDAPPMPIAPVTEFRVQGLPSGCNGPSGDCTAVKVLITFLSRHPRHGKKDFDSFTIERVFGR